MPSTVSIPEPSLRVAVPAPRRTLLFRVGETLYGTDIDDIREIVPFRRATRLPGAPRFVQGLINLRGTIVTVIDLGARLAPAATRERLADGSIMLVGVESVASAGALRVVGVSVDEVMDVRVLSTADDDGTEVVMTADDDGVVRGLAHIDGAAVVLLDIQRLVQQVLLSKEAS